MSDLIRKSDVIQILKECYLDETLFEKDVFDKINNLPMAYSVDKVVEELEDRVNEANNNCLCEMHENGHTLDFENENGRIKGLKDAIEIVKQGGVADDVCEWVIVDRPHNLPIYNTSCGKIRLQYVTGVDIYCNGCGKKIKVVE